MAGEKRYLEIRYKGEETGEWTDWSAQKELTDSLSWLNDHAGTSISTIEDFVGDETAINSVLDEGVEDTIYSESHLYQPFVQSEMATVKLAVKLAGEDHVSYDSVEELAADETAMDAVASSETAMDAVASSETAMDAVASSETAMDAVAASETAMDAVVASETAFLALWTAYDGFSDSDIPSSINSTQESSNGVKIRLGDDLADHWSVMNGPSHNAPDGYPGYVLGMNDQSENAGKHLVGFPIDLSDRNTLTVWLRNTANYGNHYAYVVIDGEEVATQKSDEDGWKKHEIDVSGYGSTTFQFGYNVSDTRRDNSDYWVGIALEIPMTS